MSLGIATPTLAEASTLAGHEGLAQRHGIRRVSTHVVETVVQGASIRQIAALAVLANPWSGTPTTASLADATRTHAPVLAKLLVDRVLDVAGGADAVQAFGKAAVVGERGEIEHAGALIHTPYFGNLVREALAGTSIICFSDAQAPAGGSLRVPMWHKTAAATRDFYQSMDVPLGDAPRVDELVVIVAASTGPRPHARIGDRSSDERITSEILKEIQL